jgi:hypothetical protein
MNSGVGLRSRNGHVSCLCRQATETAGRRGFASLSARIIERQECEREDQSSGDPETHWPAEPGIRLYEEG